MCVCDRCQELSPIEKFLQEPEEPAEDPEETEEEVEDADVHHVEEPTLPSPDPKSFTAGQSASPEPLRPEALPEEPEEEESDSSSEVESEPDPITQQPKSCDRSGVKQNVTQVRMCLRLEMRSEVLAYA